MRPRIVIPTNYRSPRESQAGGPAEVYLNERYVRLVYEAGGLPVLAPPLGHLEDDSPETHAAFDALARGYAPDGLLLTGGADLAASLYGQEMHPQARPLHPMREAAELAWFAWADAAGVPILGICLGCQVVNVGRGGSLVQYLPETPETMDHRHTGEGWHDVAVCGPMLRRIVGSDTIRVNSRHQQAVDRPGRGLRVAARAEDGVVEAVESDTAHFVLGLQWHPEYFPDAPSTQAIMAAFLAAAGSA